MPTASIEPRFFEIALTDEMILCEVDSQSGSLGNSSCSINLPARSHDAIHVEGGVTATPIAIGPAVLRRNNVGRRPPVDSPAPISSIKPSLRSASTISEIVE